MTGSIILGVFLSLLGALLGWFARRARRRIALMRATRTSTVAELLRLVEEVRTELPGEDATGLAQFVELKGSLVSDSPIIGELSGKPSVICETFVERIIETRHEVRDSNQNIRTEWRKTTETLSRNRQEAEFYMDDGTGRLRVDPTGADLCLQKIVDRFEPPSSVEESMGDQLSVGLSTFRISLGGRLGADRRTVGYRFEERVLAPNQPTYALGEVHDTSDGIVLKRPVSSEKPYILSTKTEDQLVDAGRLSAKWMQIGAYISIPAGIALVVIGLLT